MPDESIDETLGGYADDDWYAENILPRDGSTPQFKQAVATFIGQQGRLISLHSANPGTTGGSEISGGGYAKQLTTWGAATMNDDNRAQITGSLVTFTVPANVAVSYYGVWSGTSAASPGNFVYGKPLQPGAILTTPGSITMTPTHSFGLVGA